MKTNTTRDAIRNATIPWGRPRRQVLQRVHQLGLWCEDVQGLPLFNAVVTLAIFVVGIMVGVDTDALRSCERALLRGGGGGGGTCEDSALSRGIASTAQAVFTVEMAVKVAAFGTQPWLYFADAWNKLDSFVVLVGFLDMVPALDAYLALFPAATLRLLRLLRLFRLVKALPRLRAIANALVSGFGAVGWVVFFMGVFNYIAGCMCMLLFKANDPFHFGSVGRSMFTILRLETLDTWDQVLFLNLYGCDVHPSYPMLASPGPGGANLCTSPAGLGYLAFLALFLVLLVGAYIIPTVLVGIVVVSFDEATKKGTGLDAMMKEMEDAIKVTGHEPAGDGGVGVSMRRRGGSPSWPPRCFF